MAPKIATPDDQGKDDLTPRETEIMRLAWQCFQGEPKINYKKLAGLAGFANVRSASNSWASIKKKMGFTASGTEKGSAKETDKKRGAVKIEDGDDSDDTPTPTPAKKKVRTTKAKDVKVKATEEDDASTGASDDMVKLEAMANSSQ